MTGRFRIKTKAGWSNWQRGDWGVLMAALDDRDVVGYEAEGIAAPEEATIWRAPTELSA